MEKHVFSQHFVKNPAEQLRAQFAASEQRKATISKDHAFDADVENKYESSKISIEEFSRTTPYQSALDALKNTSILSPQEIHQHKNYLRIINNLRNYLGSLHLETDINLRDI